MEKKRILVKGSSELNSIISVRYDGEKVYIGDMPQLVVDLKTQHNYIVDQGERIAYHREIRLSNDLLSGKRKNVLDTAVNHYYKQACQVVKGKRVAEAYQHTKEKKLIKKQDPEKKYHLE